jgi:hypothetical protein
MAAMGTSRSRLYRRLAWRILDLAAATDVVSLTIGRRWIVYLKEELQQSAIGELLRVEGNFDRFGVTFVIAVGCVCDFAAGVSDSCLNYAGKAAYQILHPQKQPPARTARSFDPSMSLLLFLLFKQLEIFTVARALQLIERNEAQ